MVSDQWHVNDALSKDGRKQLTAKKARANPDAVNSNTITDDDIK